MHTLQSILEKLRKHKPELQRKYPISRLGIFGSYARGEATMDSDIDIAVEISGPLFKKILCMPERKPSAIIKDILNCIDHITLYTSNLSFEQFSKKFYGSRSLSLQHSDNQ
jgi:predicted nucleotidyltransferase